MRSFASVTAINKTPLLGEKILIKRDLSEKSF
jgi:hypothetical protein